MTRERLAGSYHKGSHQFSIWPALSIDSILKREGIKPWKITVTQASQLKSDNRGRRDRPSLSPVKAMPSVPATSAYSPASPLNQWSLQRCQTNQNSRYESIWADITRRECNFLYYWEAWQQKSHPTKAAISVTELEIPGPGSCACCMSTWTQSHLFRN